MVRKYDLTSIALHWATFLAVVATYAIGLIREDLPRGDLRTGLLTLHMSLGLLVIGLTLPRLLWRVTHPAPPDEAGTPLTRLAAKAAHLGLYAALLAIPALGLAAAWARARNVTFFDLFAVPSPFPPAPERVKPLEKAHEVAAHAMLLLAGLHAASAIFHQLVWRDGVLARMSPFRR